MKGATQRWLFVMACALALAIGGFLGSGRSREAAQFVETVKGAKVDSAQRKVATVAATEAALEKTDAPTQRLLLLRRTLASCETAALWQWLEQNPDGSGQFSNEVVNTLIDRLGWQAWSRVLEMEPGKLREELCYRVLYQFVRRDPWKAYEEWQAHRGEFPDPAWANGVISECSVAAAAISADKLIEIFQQITQKDSEYMIGVEFAKDFDFRKLLDHLADSEQQPYSLTEAPLRTWAERSPLEAAEWLAAHPGYLDKEYREGELRGTIRAIAGAEMDEASRLKAFEAISSLDYKHLDLEWKYAWENSDGNVTPTILQSADLAGRREEYLRVVLSETRSAEELDASWAEVPLAERQQILAAVEKDWAERRSSPVDAKARERWGKMVRSSWGIAP